MPDSDWPKLLRRWNLVSVAMLVIGLLIAAPSGLCVGVSAYELYLTSSLVGAGDRRYMEFILASGGVIFAIGLLIIYGASRSRGDPDDE